MGSVLITDRSFGLEGGMSMYPSSSGLPWNTEFRGISETMATKEFLRAGDEKFGERLIDQAYHSNV